MNECRASDHRYLINTPLQWTLEFGEFPRGSILKGLHHSAQGCEPRATLGVRRVGAPTLKGLHRLLAVQFLPKHGIAQEWVAATGREWTDQEVMQPLQGWGFLSARSPRVARGSQPWAQRFNPFRIGDFENSITAHSELCEGGDLC